MSVPDPSLGPSVQGTSPSNHAHIPLKPVPEPPLTGALGVLQYTGIPRSWLKRPRLPSKKMMVFLGTVSGLTSLYFYDRKEAKRIKQSYIDRVSHMAEVPMKTWELPRKLTVYACKWPGDDDYDRSMGYFKKYVKVCWSVVSPSSILANVSSFEAGTCSCRN